MKELKNSVQKTFAIMEYFTPQKPEWGVTELAKEIGSNKSTVFRFLAQMHTIGILDKNDQTEKYRLGLKLFELGNRVELRTALVEKTHPVLEMVAKRITETVHIAVLKDHQVFYIDKVESPQGLKISSQIGSYLPAYATSLGKVLLAFLPEDQLDRTLDHLYGDNGALPLTTNTITDKGKMVRELAEIRKKEYAIDREEFEVGLICVAIPIFNQNQQVVASLSASGPANRFNEDEVKNYVAILQEGALAIQNKIGNFKLI
ncbi:MAG: IclR family transcriptional regulator [Flavobacteriaceae bacterium]|nr:IclR family transcriptional regulator [Flavobacteriaceae bacterium]MDH3796926.1 IclR family transcriptional regulator [Flavobacteriaceae bacterium]